MVNRSRKPDTTLRAIPGNAKSNVEDDIDSLFKLPLTEVIDTRKAISTRLKKEGRAQRAAQVMALAKPSGSAWVVNQLCWRHREQFDELLETGRRIRRTQTAGKVADMRDAVDARRDVLSQLSDLATRLLL